MTFVVHEPGEVPMVYVAEYFATARERYRIRQRRAVQRNPPYTEDPIFRAWRFCNVHREHDRTTMWFREHIREPLLDKPWQKQVEAAVIFRWFNRIETVEEIEDLLVGQWDAEEAFRRLQDVKPLTTGAYIICSQPGYPKLQGVLKCIERARVTIPEFVVSWMLQHPKPATLQSAHADLCSIQYLGRFMAYEIISDLRWTPVLDYADDITTWASAGPGCARGLSRVCYGDIEHFNYGSAIDQQAMLLVMQHLLEMSKSDEYWPQQWTRWEMREVEHWSCEFDKWMRVLGGERMKRRFP